jgi:hypothetical protein
MPDLDDDPSLVIRRHVQADEQVRGRHDRQDIFDAARVVAASSGLTVTCRVWTRADRSRLRAAIPRDAIGTVSAVSDRLDATAPANVPAIGRLR